MKCPKCGYLGFEPVDRCRNCGYDFSFTPASSAPELPIRIGDSDSIEPLADLPLADSSSSRQGREVGREPVAALDRVIKSDRQRDAGTDLPLFGPEWSDDAPLITRPSAPRQPLSVRRATPEVARPRAEPRTPATGVTPMLDLEPSDANADADTRSGYRSSYRSADRSRDRSAERALDPTPPKRSARPTGSSASRGLPSPEAAGLVARVLAVAVDVLVLAVTDVAVVYFTLQICGLTPDDLGVLPKVPLIAFFIVQNGGYLVAFTAGGQTLGKMAAGIRVVSSEPGGSVDLGQSVVRTIVWGLLAIPAGLGFITALFNSDRRGLHDRCAGTRVVRAAA